MSEERMAILKMLSEGKITAEEASRLLDAVETDKPNLPPNKTPKFMRVKVASNGGDNVDIRIPLKLVKAGMALAKMSPKVEEKLREHNINLDVLAGKSGDELTEALQELQCSIDSADGEKVNIFCE